jgi:hypothetical protein
MLLKIVKILLSELKDMKKYNIRKIVNWSPRWYPKLGKSYNYKVMDDFCVILLNKLHLLLGR